MASPATAVDETAVEVYTGTIGDQIRNVGIQQNEKTSFGPGELPSYLCNRLIYCLLCALELPSSITNCHGNARQASKLRRIERWLR